MPSTSRNRHPKLGCCRRRAYFPTGVEMDLQLKNVSHFYGPVEVLN
ncbi:MAG TPA: nitrate ABC transporter ATP-binding protein, partial [Ochrobactrum sp.]|nr:nitrate ABC transporter ATP-binding protein [Ochrobactrum sp.]